MRKSALVAIWVVATFATTAAAYIAVTAAGAEVTDRPLTSVIAAGPNTDGTGTDGTAQSSTSATALTAAPGTTGPDSATTTAATGQNTTSPTTTNASTTSSTASVTSPIAWQQASIPSKGGLVVVSYRPGEVRLESVAPTPGFTYEIDDEGPPEVRVEFEGGDVRVEIRVRWDGGLVTEVDEDN